MSPRTKQHSLPIVLALLVATGVGIAIYYFGSPDFPLLVPSAALTFGVVIAGFTGAQRNMLIGMTSSRAFSFAAQTGYYEDILSYMAQCMVASLLTSLCSMVGFLSLACGVGVSVWIVALVFSVSWVVGTLVRNEILMFYVVNSLFQERRPTQEKRSPATDINVPSALPEDSDNVDLADN